MFADSHWRVPRGTVGLGLEMCGIGIPMGIGDIVNSMSHFRTPL